MVLVLEFAVSISLYGSYNTVFILLDQTIFSYFGSQIRSILHHFFYYVRVAFAPQYYSNPSENSFNRLINFFSSLSPPLLPEWF